MSYTAIVTREGDSWLADVPAVPGAHTFARSLEGLIKSVREVIVLMDDLGDDATPDVIFQYEVDDDAVLAAAEIGRERAALIEKDRDLQAAVLRSVSALKDRGYSVRDTALMLEMTPGRVSQLAAKGSDVLSVEKVSRRTR